MTLAVAGALNPNKMALFADTALNPHSLTHCPVHKSSIALAAAPAGIVGDEVGTGRGDPAWPSDQHRSNGDKHRTGEENDEKVSPAIVSNNGVSMAGRVVGQTAEPTGVMSL